MNRLPDHTADAFIQRWKSSAASERANYQLFLSELCDLIGVPRPDPSQAENERNAYVFERPVTFAHSNGDTRPGFIDLYKRGCFVLEAKQGVERANPSETPLSDSLRELQKSRKAGTATRGTAGWDDAMLRARGQAELYLRALPASEGRPPFVVVVDVGHTLELYSEFSRTGGAYIPYPAPGSHRLALADLARPDIRERLRLIWTDPLSLDPTRRSARVTREIADRLARLARLLEQQGHPADATASFLMRCLFTMFSEDVGLLRKGAFTQLLESLQDNPEHFVPMVGELWQRMDRGGFSTTLRGNIPQFNGGLFADPTALPLNQDQLLLLIEASKSDWRDVEPAIFGTLLERALDPVERHKLGAHYTPRAYVERLVLPTLVQPVRAEWDAARAAAITLANAGDLKKAAAEARAFHRRLVHLRVLDPACGSGNFLYVALEHLKRIEGEVFDLLDSLGEKQTLLEMTGETVDPHQFLGLELNPRAAAIAEIVLWIGTLQWHFRNRGSVFPPQPIIRNFKNIENRDALVAHDGAQPVLDDAGQPVTRWDGRTTKPHPVTGLEVPDESARAPVLRYANPRPAEWPEADYIIGNPPFIGPAMMRQALGDGYTETVRAAHPHVGDSSDFVMYWWDHAAALVRAGRAKRFGFVTTNSLKQKFNRRVLENHLAPSEAASGGKGIPPYCRDGNPDPRGKADGLAEGGRLSKPSVLRVSYPQSPLDEKDPRPLAILFAIPDHPWVDSADGAAVRIAMTVGAPGPREGELHTVTSETPNEDAYDVTLAVTRGTIHADLTTGADVSGAKALLANENLSCPGVKLHGAGFIVEPEEATTLGLGKVPGLERHIRLYRNGKDLAARSRDVMVIDLFGLDEDAVLKQFPSVYQHLLERVKPERMAKADTKDGAGYARLWWLHGKPRSELRKMLKGLPRYIATVETSKHRFFTFLDQSILPDNMLVNIALDDAYFLGVLSSRIHVVWALQAGGRLGMGNDPRYNKSRCFETFPFPLPTDAQKERIRALAAQLDAHRKRQLAAHGDLSMTGMYNVLERLRAGEALSAKEKVLHEHGLVSVLRQLHDDLDAAVAAAYGWSTDLPDPEILTRLVALNAHRAAEEAQGVIHHLRPAYQNPTSKPKQTEDARLLPAISDSSSSVPSSALRVPSSFPSSVPSSAFPAPSSKLPWPKTLPEQVQAIRSLLPHVPAPATADSLAAFFLRTKPERVQPILDTLRVMGVV